MNKRELEKYIKKCLSYDAYFTIDIRGKYVLFRLYGYDNREVCLIEIPYKNRLDKEAIYTAIVDLINKFDFSFRVTFTSVKEIYDFLN